MKGILLVEDYSSMSPEVKQLALKAIDLVLFNAILDLTIISKKAKLKSKTIQKVT